MRIDCEAIPEACPRVGISGTTVPSLQSPQAVVCGVGVTSVQPQAGATGGLEKATSDSIPSTQQVLNLIVATYFKRTDMSDTEKINGFKDYMEVARNLVIVGVKNGSLIITVECRSLKILDDLWDDYCTGHLNEMAQKYIVTDAILKTFGLVEVKLKTTIQEEDYRAAREFILQGSGEHKAAELRDWAKVYVCVCVCVCACVCVCVGGGGVGGFIIF